MGHGRYSNLAAAPEGKGKRRSLAIRKLGTDHVFVGTKNVVCPQFHNHAVLKKPQRQPITRSASLRAGYLMRIAKSNTVVTIQRSDERVLQQDSTMAVTTVAPTSD